MRLSNHPSVGPATWEAIKTSSGILWNLSSKKALALASPTGSAPGNSSSFQLWKSRMNWLVVSIWNFQTAKFCWFSMWVPTLSKFTSFVKMSSLMMFRTSCTTSSTRLALPSSFIKLIGYTNWLIWKVKVDINSVLAYMRLAHSPIANLNQHRW